jgi:2-keto-4-pentenoate hydratase/2-oxohepta-3-ene-1,7-dioic acid hydratase in catechol pathway
LRVGKLGKGIEKRFAHRYYDAIGLGIDFTARDVQNKLKAKGLPWEKAKAFDRAAVIGSVFLPVESFEDLKNIGFRLDINGNTVQDGNSGLMIYDFDTIISYVSSFVTLKIGDLIYTGTPVGVGPVHSGDVLAGYLEAQEMFRFKVK